MSTAQNLTLDELEDESLRLPPESRAELVESLLASFTFTGPNPVLQREWLAEAECRRRELVVELLGNLGANRDRDSTATSRGDRGVAQR